MSGAAQDPTLHPDYVKFVAGTYRDDPYGYFLDILGADEEAWQQTAAESVRDHKRTAVSSGHGIGKTRFAAMIIHWFMSTRPSPAIVATANTEDQLSKKLWRELKKVNDGAKNRSWFDWKNSTFTAFGDATHQAVALAWSENNSEAFAGTHEAHVLGVFDEASAIARSIFNVFEGAMTTAGARWLLLGNPTRAEGYFFDACHGKLKARRPGDLGEGKWNSFVIGSAESTRVDSQWVAQMKLTMGENSDEYRIRVLGLPPKFDREQYIPREWVLAAQDRRLDMFDRWPLIIGCDIGRGDRSVALPRRGRVVLPDVKILEGERTTDFARRLTEIVKMYRGEMGLEAQLIIEELGMGVGVLETLQDMGYGEQVWGVNTGNPSKYPELYLNLRNEMWGLMKEWLEGDVELPNIPELVDDLCSIKTLRNGRGVLRLETKQEMRARKLPSPDVGDALALTFALDFDLLPDRRLRRDDYREMETAGGGQTWMAM
jgi:hypothetical protein